ncbi:MAG: hypothetical protein OEZ39_19710 [Gammaproteobacteria bacterium]|nr:hypothetical protein [Gammaproteobacteria bacterium]MDH5654094.1 hypothetical protein [Gammaproteobacteria bacterium]
MRFLLRKSWFVLPFLILSMHPVPAPAADYICTPVHVAVFKGRLHVRCNAAAKDGTASIWFWAVPTSDAHHANRFLSVTSSALIAGRKIRFSYTNGDTSGQAFGCLAKDCRVPWMTAIQ